MKRILFPSSTGGHLNEILQLKLLFGKYETLVVTENVPINISILSRYNYQFVRPAKGDKKSIVFWRDILVNFVLAFKIIVKFKPDAIVTTGSHTAIPFCLIGKLFRCKIIYITSFCRTSSTALSANLIYPFSDLFIVQWEEIKKYYKKSIYVGQIY